MAIHKMARNKERLEKISTTSFGKEGVMERQDLQRILRDQPEILEEGLFVITEEFSNWEGSGRSIDLLGLDATGRLVVIELKRGETGKHMDLQAIRYAAMVSTITSQQAIEAHQAYLTKLGIEEDAEERINDHLENPQSRGFSAERPRIVLVSEDFSPELTTCALWLNDSGLNVTCIRMQPHRSDTELLVETSQIIPLPETQSYLVKVRAREDEQANAQRSVMGQFFLGGQIFGEQIEVARQEFKAELRKLYGWAIGLEQEGLAVLSTYKHEGRCNLLIGLPIGNNPCLIRLITDRHSISFQPRYFRIYAADSVQNVEALTNLNIYERKGRFHVGIQDVDDKLLGALRCAYREANGFKTVGNVAED